MYGYERIGEPHHAGLNQFLKTITLLLLLGHLLPVRVGGVWWGLGNGHTGDIDDVPYGAAKLDVVDYVRCDVVQLVAR